MENAHVKCYSGCPRACHKKLKYLFDPLEAQAAGADVSIPTTASKCDDLGGCSCLDLGAATEKGKAYRQEGHHDNIAEVKEVYDTASACLESCECEDENKKGAGSDKEYVGLCADAWNWSLALHQWRKENYCLARESEVGLRICGYDQTFKLEEDKEAASRTYHVQLDELRSLGGEGLQNIGLNVAKFFNFKELKRGGTESFDVEVGLNDAKTKWTISHRSSMYGKDVWHVQDHQHEKVLFNIQKQKGDAVWCWYAGSYTQFEQEGDALLHVEEEDSDQGDFDFALYEGPPCKRVRSVEGIVTCVRTPSVERDDYVGHAYRHDDHYIVKLSDGKQADVFLTTIALIADRSRGSTR